MRPLLSLREAALTAWSAKVPTVLVLLLTGIMCAATLATVGRSAQAEADVLSRLESAGSRELTISARVQEQLMPPVLIAQVAGLSVTERAVGLTTAVDVTNTAVGSGGPATPAWQVIGDLAAVATLTSGRWPAPGEAIVSVEAAGTLGMTDGAGSVTHTTLSTVADYSVVGTFTARAPFEELDDGILIAAPKTTATATTMSVVLTDAREAARAQSLVLGLIDARDIASLTITSPVSLAELQGQVTGDLGAFGRVLLLGVLGGGALLVAIVVLADVLVRRPDLGRRRALGATRSAILVLVVLRTALPALLGALLGSAVGITITHRLGAVPPTDFVVATGILAVLSAILSTLAPAAFAATRDPVRVLRTP